MDKEKKEFLISVDARLERIIPKFMTYVKTDFEAIQQAVIKADYAALMNLGHKMKGSCGGYGFHELGKMAAQLESSAEKKDDSTIRSAMEQMAEHIGGLKICYEKK